MEDTTQAERGVGPVQSNALLGQPDATFSFSESFKEFWQACGDKASWTSGLTDRIAKRMMWLAGQNVPDWNQDQFEAAMSNYGRRKLYLTIGR